MVLTSNAVKFAFPFFIFLFLLISQVSFAQTRVIVNPGLEFGVTNSVVQIDSNFGFGNTFDAGAPATSPWYTSHTAQAGACAPGFVGNCHPIEVWHTGTGPNNVVAAQGNNFVELNAFESSMIYQNMYLVTGDFISYYYRHRARNLTTERSAMVIEDQNQTNIATVNQTAASSSLSAWSENQGIYQFTGTSGVYRVGFRALVNGGSPGAGNFLDDIRITLNPVIDLKFTNALSSCEGSSNGNLFLRINGAVTSTTTVAVQLVNPANGLPFITDSDINVTPVANSNGTPTVVHTPGSTIYLITIPPGNYDGGATPGFSSPSNDEDGIALNIASVSDGLTEPNETFKFEIRQQQTNGSSNNFVSTSSPIFGDTYYGSSGNYYINNCPDADGDGIVNDLDWDDDNDGIPDTAEGCAGTVTMATVSPALATTLATNNTVVFPLVPPGTTLPQGGVRITKTSGGNGWATFTPTNATATLSIGGSTSAAFSTTYLDVVAGGSVTTGVPRTLTIDFGNPARAISTTNNEYQYVIGIAGLGNEGASINTNFSVPLTAIQNINVFGTGRFSLFNGVTPTPGQVGSNFSTSTPNTGPNQAQGYTFFLVPKDVASFIMNITGGDDPHGFIFGVYRKNCTVDTDSDGILDYLDLDSDNDGCFDAIEGDENVLLSQLNANGSINTVANGGVGTNAVTNNGIPNLVNTGGVADIGSDIGQGIGTSKNASVQDIQCSTAIGCTGALYLAQSNTLYSVNTTSNPFTYPAIGVNQAGAYNAIGINPVNGRMYAMGSVASSNDLYVINANGTSINLGPVTNLPLGAYNSGEIDNLGNYYVKESGSNNLLYRINLTTLTATSIPLSMSISVADLAFRTTNSFLYTVSNDTGQLMSIDPATGTVTGIGGSPGTIAFGALFGSSTGEIYGSENGGGFYQFNLTTGQRVLISNSPASGSNDGAHCVTTPIAFSADLAVTKTDNTTTYAPGSTRVYTIVARNNGPFGVLGATVSDPLPAGIVAANMSYTAAVAGGGTTSVVGTQTGAINDVVNLPVNATVTYTVTVTVPFAFTGDLVNTVTITSPANSTDSNLTNNTATDTDTQAVCYRPGATVGTVLDTNHGITALARAGSTAPGNWPMVRKGAWTVLESRTKGFVVNRLTTQQISQIPAANLVEGMMVYNTDVDCLQVNTTGTPAGWACFNTPTCPSN